MASIQAGDIGTEFLVTIQDSGVAVNISSYTTREILFREPGGTLVTKTATFKTDGTNGQITYTSSASTDFETAGTWRIQGHIAKSGSTFRTEQSEFEVLKNAPNVNL